MMIFHFTNHPLPLAVSLIWSFFLGVSCSHGQLQKSEVAPEKGDISSETLQLDYQDIPMGIIVTCSAPGEQEHLTVRETFQDTSHLSESNMRSFMETETRLSADSSANSSHVSSGAPLVVNQPGGVVSSSTSQVVAMSENFSHKLVPESYSLNTDQVVFQQPSQVVHQGVSQGGKVKGGKAKRVFSVNQAGKVKGPGQGVAQGVNQGVAQGVNQGIQQSKGGKNSKSSAGGVAQGSFSSPGQFPLTHAKGYIPNQSKSSKASLGGPGQQQHIARASFTSQLNSADDGTQAALCDQDHLSNHYRPSAESSRLAPFRWGYYGAPRMISSGNRTYYILTSTFLELKPLV